MPKSRRSLFKTGALALSALLAAMDAAGEETLRFDLGTVHPAPGWIPVTADTVYSPQRGHGLVRIRDLATSSSGGEGMSSTSLSSSEMFSFAVRLPEGNYDVVVHLGDPRAAAETCVKAETRRLLLEPLATAPGQIETRRFTVNIRTTRLSDGRSVALKPREDERFHWDDTLLLEFNGKSPAVAAIEITPNPGALTVFLAGDSTVTDQPGTPWHAWGQMLPRFFEPGVAVSNHAESGLALSTFKSQRRLQKVLEMLKPGDFVLIQFGHNDQKEKGDGIGAFTSYAQSLRDFVSAVRGKGGHPVLVTPVYRRRFNEDGLLYDTLGDFPEAVRRVAAETGTPLIDLHALSARFLAALGPEASKAAFVHFKAGAYPGHDKDMRDDTHSSGYGAYELARCVVEGIRASVPALAARLATDLPPYSPDHPMAPASFHIPESPLSEDSRIPDGDGG